MAMNYAEAILERNKPGPECGLNGLHRSCRATAWCNANKWQILMDAEAEFQALVKDYNQKNEICVCEFGTPWKHSHRGVGEKDCDKCGLDCDTRLYRHGLAVDLVQDTVKELFDQQNQRDRCTGPWGRPDRKPYLRHSPYKISDSYTHAEKWGFVGWIY